MILRAAFGLAVASTLFLAIGCGAPPSDLGKDGKRVGGSPNDPGWVPPGANPGPGQDDVPPQPDDQQEQPTGNPPTCTPRTMPIPFGWTVHASTHLSIATPSAWIDLGSKEDHLLFAVSPLRGSTGVDANMTAFATLEDDVASWEMSLTSKQDRTCNFVVSDTSLRCDAAKRLHAMCVGNAPLDVTVLVVEHDGVIFDAGCGGSSDVSSCPNVLDTLQFPK